jgi:hypothetical protein
MITASLSAEIARILPYTVITMIIFGPMMMIGCYFQAIGDAPRAALLGLSRTYLFALAADLPAAVLVWRTGDLVRQHRCRIAGADDDGMLVLAHRQRANRQSMGGFFEARS